MYPLLEATTLLVITILFWSLRGRRKYYLQRIAFSPFINLASIARNIAFMLCRKPVELHGSVSQIRPGCILYSVHYGIWERMPEPLVALGYDVGIIVNRYGKEKGRFLGRVLDRLLTRFRSHQGVSVFDKEDTMRISRFLKKGGVLGVLVDGNRMMSKLHKIQKLATLCHAPLIPFAAYRRNTQGMIDIGCNIESLVQRKPHDYLWFYRSRTP